MESLRDSLQLKGEVFIRLFDKEGKLKDERIIKNLVVTAGKNYTASWLAAASQSGYFMQYLAVGTGTTAPAAGDTALESEIGTRVAGTITSSTNVWQNVGTFAAGNATGGITEAGIFSASSGGTMLARQTFSVINKGANDSLEITWQIQIS